MILVLLTIFMITIPAIVRLVRNESLWTVKQVKSTVAFHSAEAGIDRACWKLQESRLWQDAATGVFIAGYRNDTVYTDVNGGEYKILITTGQTSSQVTIVTRGRDTVRNEVRAIECVLDQTVLEGATHVDGGIKFKKKLRVEWGPIYSHDTIELDANIDKDVDPWPRKFCAVGIKNRDTNPAAPNGGPPWDIYDYAAYQDIGEAPEINLAYYAQKAKNSQIPAPDKGTQDPPGSGYIVGDALFKTMGSGKAATDYYISNSTTVIYVTGTGTHKGDEDGDCRLDGKAWVDVEALVVTGHIHIHSDGRPYAATIPLTASQEYQYNPDAVSWWNSKGWTNGGTYTIPDCVFHGFLYVGGDFHCSGGVNSICGTVAVDGDMNVNTMTIFYDKSVAETVSLKSSTFRKTSWKELTLPWN